MSVTMHRNLVPYTATALLLRRMLLEIRRDGLEVARMSRWDGDSWWPHLRTCAEVQRILAWVEAGVVRQGPGEQWAEPQLIFHLPNEEDAATPELHVDAEPPWALRHGLRYKTIVSVELAALQGPQGGGLEVFDGGRLKMCYPMNPGDAVQLSPDVQHRGTPNLGSGIRAAVVFRLLAPAATMDGEGASRVGAELVGSVAGSTAT